MITSVFRSKTKTDYELVNLRIDLEEAKNENSLVLQVKSKTRGMFWIQYLPFVLGFREYS